MIVARSGDIELVSQSELVVSGQKGAAFSDAASFELVISI